jgi:hypothetical protein
MEINGILKVTPGDKNYEAPGINWIIEKNNF